LLRGSFSEDTKGACSGRLFARGEGAPKRRYAPHLGGGRTLRERAQASREKGKGLSSIQVGKESKHLSGKDKLREKDQDKDRGKQEEEGSPRQGAPYFTRLVGKSSRNSKAPESGCYCTRFTCLCFLCCTFCFEAFYIHISQTVFPWGGFIQCHVDQKYLCQIYACL
jgi:hypothetical protein